jgi:hypothetical protein
MGASPTTNDARRIEMFKHTRAAPVLLVPAAFLALAAGGDDEKEGEEVELDEAEVFIEWNSTDGDFGIQFFWDGDGWDRMRVENSEGKVCLQVRARDNLQEQGLTEGFFESVEPDPDELSMEEFLERFPEGEYEFEGKTLEGEELEGETEFTHVIPAPPTNLFPAEGDVINVALPLIVSCDAVTEDFEGKPLEPEIYELVVENTDDETFVFTIVLPGDASSPSATVPPEFLEPGGNYKLEVIVQEESHNRSITETSFSTL